MAENWKIGSYKGIYVRVQNKKSPDFENAL